MSYKCLLNTHLQLAVYLHVSTESTDWARNGCGDHQSNCQGMGAENQLVRRTSWTVNLISVETVVLNVVCISLVLNQHTVNVVINKVAISQLPTFIFKRTPQNMDLHCTILTFQGTVHSGKLDVTNGYAVWATC